MIASKAHHRFAVCMLVACSILAVAPVECSASLIGTFALLNTQADGTVLSPSVLFPSDMSSFDLTGGNDGTGLEGLTSFVGTVPLSGTVSFHWSYTACYPPYEQPPSIACDIAGYDWAGYINSGVPTQLTDTDTQGVSFASSFDVMANASFGWYVGTSDNGGEPGTLTVSNILFTPATSNTPEPGTFLIAVAGISAIAARRRCAALLNGGHHGN